MPNVNDNTAKAICDKVAALLASIPEIEVYQGASMAMLGGAMSPTYVRVGQRAKALDAIHGRRPVPRRGEGWKSVAAAVEEWRQERGRRVRELLAAAKPILDAAGVVTMDLPAKVAPELGVMSCPL